MPNLSHASYHRDSIQWDASATALPADTVSDPLGETLSLLASRSANGTTYFPVTSICPDTLEPPAETIRLSGEGSLYAYSTVHVSSGRFKAPYILGYVDLPEGVRLFTRIPYEARERLRPDAPMRLKFLRDPQNSSRLDFVFVPLTEK